MWRRLMIRSERSSTLFRRATSIVISKQSRRIQRLMESRSPVVEQHRHWNGDSNAWPTGVMSRFSSLTPACTGAVAMSMFESCPDDDDKLWQSSRVKLVLGVLSVNFGVYAAFSLGHILRSRWNAASQLYQFMHNNFILSLEQLEHRRWHVLVTHCCTHIDAPHLLQNCFLSVPAFIAEPPRVTIPLFASGTVLSAVLGVFMLKRYGKSKIGIVGSSCALYTMFSYIVLNKDWKHIPLLLPIALVIGEACRQAANMGKRSGLSPARTISHTAHFAGLMLGILIYFVSKQYSSDSSDSTQDISLIKSRARHAEKDKA